MSKALLIIGSIILVVMFIRIIRIFTAPTQTKPVLYLKVARDAENIEWLLRQFCASIKDRPMIVIDEAEGETSLILAKLSRYYGYQLSKQTDIAEEDVLIISRGVGIKDLRKQFRILEHKEKYQKMHGLDKG